MLSALGAIGGQDAIEERARVDDRVGAGEREEVRVARDEDSIGRGEHEPHEIVVAGSASTSGWGSGDASASMRASPDTWRRNPRRRVSPVSSLGLCSTRSTSMRSRGLTTMSSGLRSSASSSVRHTPSGVTAAATRTFASGTICVRRFVPGGVLLGHYFVHADGRSCAGELRELLEQGDTEILAKRRVDDLGVATVVRAARIRAARTTDSSMAYVTFTFAMMTAYRIAGKMAEMDTPNEAMSRLSDLAQDAGVAVGLPAAG